MDTLPGGSVVLRTLTQGDVPGLVALARAQKRNASEEDAVSYGPRLLGASPARNDAEPSAEASACSQGPSRASRGPFPGNDAEAAVSYGPRLLGAFPAGNDAEDYERLLRLEGARGWVLVREGALLGAVTGMRYFDHGFLGPVLLRDGPDATGLAVVLLAHLVEGLQREGALWLEAEAARTEEAVLARMGFERVRSTLVMERSAPGDGAPGASVPMEERHVLDVGALDAAAAGFGRKEYLLALRQTMPEGARVVEENGAVVGYALLRRGSRGHHVGPLVTREGDFPTARGLLRDVAASAHGPLVALVPDDDATLTIWREEGFREVGTLARMRAGPPDRTPPDVRAHAWALGGRVTG